MPCLEDAPREPLLKRETAAQRPPPNPCRRMIAVSPVGRSPLSYRQRDSKPEARICNPPDNPFPLESQTVPPHRTAAKLLTIMARTGHFSYPPFSLDYRT